MYIAQWIAKHTSHSRRSAVELVKAGRVSLNDQVATVTDHVEADDRVRIDDQDVGATPSIYLKVHKPVGYVCTRTPQDDRPTVYALLPEGYQRLTYAGRLDADSSGLLLMSNDGDWIQTLTHPSHELLRVYHVELDRSLAEADRVRIQTGVELEDGTSSFALSGKERLWRLELREGRNRQVRRTFEALGYTVKKLHRTKHGDYSLGKLGAGEYIEINR